MTKSTPSMPMPAGFWFAQVDRRVVTDTSLSSREFRIYAVLCVQAGGGRSASLTVQHICEMAGCKERTAQNALTALEKRGLIRREKHFKNGLQLASTYHLIGCKAECYADELEDSTGTGAQIPAADGVQIPASSAESCTGDGQNSAPQVLEIRSLRNKPERPTPLTPQTENGPEDGRSRSESEADSAFCEDVLAKYRAILPELAQVEELTLSHVREIEARMREDPARMELAWWERYFRSIRDYPYAMGQSPSGWRASFEWLIGGRGMQKVLGGAFIPASTTMGGSEHGWELQKRYTNEEGVVDARALLRESG